jgi:carboxyl-terminal processing protease
MSMPRFLRAALCAMPVLLTACGGGDDGDRISNGCPSSAASGGTADRQDWLRCYFNQTYLWYQLSPNPPPAGFSTVEAYFNALVYGGGDPIPGGGGAVWPADDDSNFQSTESFNRFFGDGRTLGYGVAVTGLEAQAQGSNRLFVRYVEPLSPAAQSATLAGGVQRGDEIVAINNTPVATLIAADDFSGLNPSSAGQSVRLDVRRGAGATVPVVLNAAEFALTPVQLGQRVLSPGGRSIGYVFVKDMVSQVGSPLATTMASFKNQGIDDLVLDLRYNGGGLVSMGSTVASYASGSPHNRKVYAQLLYNDKQSGNNQTFEFSNPNAWAGFPRVYVLMGERTCSASEQVINGLLGVGVTVVTIGDVTCGKPVGFLPDDDGFGTTYSIVNFEGVNARNEGRYFDGLEPTCAVAEDFSQPIGDTGEGDLIGDPLLVAAAFHVDNSACPVALTRESPASRAGAARKRYNGADGGERSGMSAR